MNIEILRSIGQRLRGGISPGKIIPRKAVGIGASGDETYQIDKVAEDIIVSSLKELREPLTVVSEEIGLRELRGGGTIVLIDPVDGSRNAIAGIPFYGTSIAVAGGNTIGDIFLSYVINLVTGDEFWADKGNGAYLHGERITTQNDDVLHVTAYEAQSPANDIARIIALLSESRKTRCLGATALDIAYLARGSISVFVSPSPSRSFDFGGGWLLVQEAGGVFTDLEGNPIDSVEIGLKKSTSLLVSGNIRLHEKVLRLLSRRS